MQEKMYLGNLLNSLIKKFDLFTAVKCPKCKSLDYSRDFLFKEKSIPLLPSTPSSERVASMPPLYQYECTGCHYEWYS